VETIPDDGAALLHEHLFIDSRGRYPVPNGMAQPVALDAAPLTLETLAAARRTPWAIASQVLQLDSVDAAIHELIAFQQRCGGALVCDATPCDEGRDPAKLRRAALQSGVLLVMGASVARASFLPGNGSSMGTAEALSGFAQAALISEVAAALELELRVGVEVPSANCPMVGSSGDYAAGTMHVHAGFIGELNIGQGATFTPASALPNPTPPGSETPPLLEATLALADMVYLAGAARAQAATGCLILVRICPGGARGALRCDPLAAKPHAVAALARAALATIATNGGNLARVAIAGVDELLLALATAAGSLPGVRVATSVTDSVKMEAEDAQNTLRALRLAGVSVIGGGFGRSLALGFDELAPDAASTPLPLSDESLARGLAALSALLPTPLLASPWSALLPQLPPTPPPPQSLLTGSSTSKKAPLGLVLAGHGAHTKLETLRGGGGGLSHVSSWPQGAVAVRFRRAAAAMLSQSENGGSVLGVAHAKAEGVEVEGTDAAAQAAAEIASSLNETELRAVLRGGRPAAQLLAWWTPVEAPPAPLATSRCSWCAKGFVYVESEHFSKFNFEYCRAKCLRAHRVAGFAEPAPK